MGFLHPNQNHPVPLYLTLLYNLQIQGSPIPYPHRSIKMLARLIEEHAVIHIRGTPASGKSTMAKFLFRHYSCHYLSKQQPIVVFVANWKDWVENNMDTVGFLVRQCHKLGHKIQRTEFLDEVNENLIFILDGAQVTYSVLTLRPGHAQIYSLSRG